MGRGGVVGRGGGGVFSGLGSGLDCRGVFAFILKGVRLGGGRVKTTKKKGCEKAPHHGPVAP